MEWETSMSFTFKSLGFQSIHSVLRLTTNENADQRSVTLWNIKKKSFRYILYNPSDHKLFVSQSGFFIKRELISKEACGSPIDLDEIN